MNELTKEFTIQEHHTALVVGSGSLKVLGTPVLIAFMENVCASLYEDYLSEGETSVGTMIQAKHLKASSVGSVIKVHGVITEQEDKQMRFSIDVHQGYQLIATGEHTRAKVMIERFKKSILS
ncbi:thioesterase family protein [Aerococcaceae bacterium DSM 111020]|nr:thioesterase family protein [Aerococcaceae bacterium DSM 111020]